MLEKYIKDERARRAVGFIVRFLMAYFILNMIYYVYHRAIFPDTVFFTEWAAIQSKYLLNWMGESVTLYYDYEYPQIYLMKGELSVVSIFEGCNGASLYIIFVSFLFAFFLPNKRTLLYIIIGLFVLNAANLVRIVALYFVSLYKPDDMYFYHKYLFNGVLFAIVIGLWFGAIKLYNAYRR